MPHTPPLILEKKTKSVAYYSTEIPRNLVIFVHGYSGGATSTWIEFPSLVHNNPEFSESDIIFYGYDSTSVQANVNAARFKNFYLKHTLSTTPTRNKLTQTTLPDNFQYDNILLVAHSLGAIVVRRALLLVNTEVPGHPFLNKTHMILFAPAHKGTLVSESFMSLLPSTIRIMAMANLWFRPVIRNLERDSWTIRDLIRDTQLVRDQGAGQFTIARRVLWAETEQVVWQDYFDPNENPVIIPATKHSTVCKPINNTFIEPVNYVISELL